MWRWVPSAFPWGRLQWCTWYPERISRNPIHKVCVLLSISTFFFLLLQSYSLWHRKRAEHGGYNTITGNRSLTGSLGMRSLLLLLLLVSRTECSSFLFSPFSRVTMIMVIIITVRLASGCVYLSASGLPCVCPCSFHIPSNDEPVASYKGKLVSPAFAHTHTLTYWAWVYWSSPWLSRARTYRTTCSLPGWLLCLLLLVAQSVAISCPSLPTYVGEVILTFVLRRIFSSMYVCLFRSSVKMQRIFICKQIRMPFTLPSLSQKVEGDSGW